MRRARLSRKDTPQYAFVQKDATDGKDCLVVLDGHPLLQQVTPTGERVALDEDGVRLLEAVIPSKVYGLGRNYEAQAQFMH
uniref:DUF2437 domain-containing protein n=1 Tax=Bifidobacterium animalis TaxID=28025 RepID=UPI001BCEF71F